MNAYIHILIPIGIAIFILRAQILRVSIRELGPDNLYASPELGAAAGWASLFGGVTLAICALVSSGLAWGFVSIAIGICLGIVGAVLFLPMLGSTLAFGHHGGEGDRSIAAFNHRYGHVIAFAIAGLAVVSLYAIFSSRL